MIFRFAQKKYLLELKHESEVSLPVSVFVSPQFDNFFFAFFCFEKCITIVNNSWGNDRKKETCQFHNIGNQIIDFFDMFDSLCFFKKMKESKTELKKA